MKNPFIATHLFVKTMSTFNMSNSAHQIIMALRKNIFLALQSTGNHKFALKNSVNLPTAWSTYSGTQYVRIWVAPGMRKSSLLAVPVALL